MRRGRKSRLGINERRNQLEIKEKKNSGNDMERKRTKAKGEQCEGVGGGEGRNTGRKV